METKVSDSEVVLAGSGVDTQMKKRTPRERLLEAANELFYAEGVHTVGIDRVIERAGVAKASLYSTFGSKEELVYEYLEARHERTLRRLRAAADSASDPTERVLAVFDSQAAQFVERDFRGCAFNAATAEAPAGSKVLVASRSYRADVHRLLSGLVAQAGAFDPETLATQLQLIFDGASLASKSERSGAITAPARAAIMTLLTASIPAQEPKVLEGD